MLLDAIVQLSFQQTAFRVGRSGDARPRCAKLLELEAQLVEGHRRHRTSSHYVSEEVVRHETVPVKGTSFPPQRGAGTPPDLPAGTIGDSSSRS